MGILSHGLAHGAAPADYTVENSLKFDGSDSYLSRANGDTTTTWTMAFWFKRSAISQSGNQYLVSWSNSNEGISLRGTSGSYADKISVYTAIHNYTSRVFRDPSAWYHCCLAVTDTEGILYINGESIKTEIDGIAATGTIEVGAWSGGSNFNGYIADFCYISGSAIAPDTNFIEEDSNGQWVPKEYTVSGSNSFHLPFTNTAGATVFTDSSGTDAVATFTDSSSIGHTITPTNVTHARTEKKVDDTSIYFDGTDSNALVASTSTDFATGTGDYTAEAWVYLKENPSYNYTALFGNWISNLGWVVETDVASGTNYWSFYDSTAGRTASNVVATLNTWHHVAVVRNGTGSGETSLYVDGVRVTTATSSSNVTASQVFTLGQYYGFTTYSDESYIDEFRFVKGHAVYSGTDTSSANFDLPTGGLTTTGGTYTGSAGTSNISDPTDSQTKLLIHSDGIKHTITPTNATHTRAEKKVGDSSIYFDGSGDKLTTDASTSFTLDGEFTIEAWIKRNGTGGWDDIVNSVHYNSSSWDGNFTARISNSDKMQMRVKAGGASSTYYIYKTGSTAVDANWHHVAFVRDSSDNIKFYLDGVEESTTDSENPTDEAKTLCEDTDAVIIGGDNQDFGGYIDEVRISDTARYTEDFDDDLPTTAFTDDSNTMLLIHSDWNGGLGADGSGNLNDFAATELDSHDRTIDSASSGKNFCTWNPLSSTAASTYFSEGNLTTSTGTSNYRRQTGSMAFPASGKFYFEVYQSSVTSGGSFIGVCSESAEISESAFAGSHSLAWGYYEYSSTYYHKYNNNVGSALGSSHTLANGAIIGVLVNNGALSFYRNGSLIGEAYTGITGDLLPLISDGSGSYASTYILNAGQDATFNGNHSGTPVSEGGGEWAYAPASESDYKAICTANLPAPGLNNAVAPAFAVKAYDDGDGAKTFGGAANMKPDLVWVKSRGSSSDHKLTDSVRGATEALESNTSDAEETESDGVESFDTDGFTVGDNSDYDDETGDGMVAWCWKAGTEKTSEWGGDTSITPTKENYNADAGFSIISYTGNSSGGGYNDDEFSPTYYWDRVPHTLGYVPELILIKNRDDDGMGSSYSWAVWHKDLSDDEELTLNSNDNYSSNGLFPTSNAVHTDQYFTIGNDGMGSGGWERVNGMNSDTYEANDYIAYLFRSIPGYSRVGSFVGNSSNDGVMVSLDFAPAYIWMKSRNVSSNWIVYDNKRSTYNVQGEQLKFDLTNYEGFQTRLDFLSNGFRNRLNSLYNNSSNTTLFYAVAEIPTKFANAR